jgi:4-amino-4-deoxy-L-arabinose transferase
MVHLRAPDFWRYFIMVEHVQRFTEDVESQHPEGWWFFIPVLIGGAMPWMFLLPVVIKSARDKWREFLDDRLVRYALCWFVFPFLFFSASSGKLATYILPCFPAIAILFSVALLKYFKNNHAPSVFNNCVKVLCWLLGSLVVVFCIFQFITLCAPEAMHKVILFRLEETWKWILAAVAMCSWCTLLVFSFRSKIPAFKLAFFAFGPLPALCAYHFVVPQMVLGKSAPETFLLEHADRITPETKIVSYKNLIGAVCWYYKRSDVYIYHKAGELAYGISQPGSEHRLISKEEFAEEVEKKRSGNIVIIMNSRRNYRELPEKGVKLDFASGENYFREY